MPITPAHASAAWPLRPLFRHLPLAALVIGTMSPDFEYVLRLEPRGRFGHSPLGLFIFCVPASLVVWLAWRSIVRPALVPLLPPGMRADALAPPPGRRSDQPALAAAGALLGAATHVLWDGFTHVTGWGLAVFPVLNAQVPHVPMHWWAALQYISSVVGAVIVLAWILVAIFRYPARERRLEAGQGMRIARAAALVLAFTLVAAAANAAVASSALEGLARAAVGAMAGFALGLMAYGMMHRPPVPEPAPVG